MAHTKSFRLTDEVYSLNGVNKKWRIGALSSARDALNGEIQAMHVQGEIDRRPAWCTIAVSLFGKSCLPHASTSKYGRRPFEL